MQYSSSLLPKWVAALALFQFIHADNSLASIPYGPQVSCTPALQTHTHQASTTLIPVDQTNSAAVSHFLNATSPTSREYDFQNSRARISLTLSFVPEPPTGPNAHPNVLGTLSIAKAFFERTGHGAETEVALMMAFYTPTRLKVRRDSTGLELSANATSQGSPRLRIMVNESIGHHPAFTLTCDVSE